MFQKGEYIVYGSSGVCRVEEIGYMEMAGAMKGKLYYTLHPVYGGGSTIFTPTDNDKIVMREVISKEEANCLLEEIEDMDVIPMEDEKRREEIYRGILRECDCGTCLRLLKTLYQRQYRRIESGKKVAALDERYLKMAEESLFGELSVVLEREKEQVAKIVKEKLSKKVLTTN